MRPRIKSDGTTCYEYIFLYVDNAVAVSENAEDILQNEIGRHFYLKEESIGHLTLYLGGHVQKIQLDNGVWAWAFSLSQDVQATVKSVAEYIAKDENKHLKIPSKADTPL